MKEKELVEAGEEFVRTRGRGGNSNYNNSLQGAKKEDVSRCMRNCLEFYGVEQVRTDEETRERLNWFFNKCYETGQLPTVEKLAMGLGIVRQTLWNWENGIGCSSERMDLIKRAKEFIAGFESEMVTEGKINPVVYIFRAKNYFGMKDQQDVVVAPSQPLGDIQGRAQLEAKLADVVIDDA